MNRSHFLTATSATLAALFPGIAHAQPVEPAPPESSPAPTPSPPPEPTPLPTSIELDDLVAAIPGSTAVYVRLANGTIPVAIDATTRYATASVIKVLIMATAYTAYDQGDATPNTRVPFNRGDIVGGSEIFGRSRIGEEYPMSAMVRAMIQYSDNAASNALISFFGTGKINEIGQLIGLQATTMARRFGCCPDGVPNLNRSTARDMGELLYAIEIGLRDGVPRLLSPQSCQAMIDMMLGQEDREKIPAGLPRGVRVANKTGEIERVRNDVAIVDPYGARPFVLAILTKDVRNYRQTIAGMRQIAQRVYEAVQ